MELPSSTDRVINLFVSRHWFLWCVVIALVLAILCAYSLWKKRRTLCGWSFSEHHVQSEGDSAGSCYAPPQYSRCNSFHHPPPLYTEVVSKPDLYPIVFSCNSDNGKNGAGYLMVQYFRNYIVRPAGSLSATSTIDSLSSSFICNSNEANTLVPPPYSHAASPDISCGVHNQQHQQTTNNTNQHSQFYILARSASQQVCPNIAKQHNTAINNASRGIDAEGGGDIGFTDSRVCSENNASVNIATQPKLLQKPKTYDSEALNINENTIDVPSTNNHYSAYMSPLESEHYLLDEYYEDSHNDRKAQNETNLIQSAIDQHLRIKINSNNKFSNTYIYNNYIAAEENNKKSITGTNDSNEVAINNIASQSNIALAHSGTPTMYSNCYIKLKALPRDGTIVPQLADTQCEQTDNCSNSRSNFSIAAPVASVGSDTVYKDLYLLQRNLKTSGNFFQRKQKQLKTSQQKSSFEYVKTDSFPLQLQGNFTKYSNDTTSTVLSDTSIVNISTSCSSPQITSPTCESPDIFERRIQLQEISRCDESLIDVETKPMLHQSLSTPLPPSYLKHDLEEMDSQLSLKRYGSLTNPEQGELQQLQPAFQCKLRSVPISMATKNCLLLHPEQSRLLLHQSYQQQKEPNRRKFQELQQQPQQNIDAYSYKNSYTKIHTVAKTLATASVVIPPSNGSAAHKQMHVTHTTAKRPVSLLHQQHNCKNKYFYSSKPNKAIYIPMVDNVSSPAPTRCALSSLQSSAIGSSIFLNHGYLRKSWTSRSAPTTPDTNLPLHRIDDESPLLKKNDEDVEEEENTNLQ